MSGVYASDGSYNMTPVGTATVTPEKGWSFAAPSGGTGNTTAVEIKAASAGVTHYLSGVQINSDALTAATELVITSEPTGTVLYRIKIGTVGLIEGYAATFRTPLASASGESLSYALLTNPVAGAVFLNAQGTSE